MGNEAKVLVDTYELIKAALCREGPRRQVQDRFLELAAADVLSGERSVRSAMLQLLQSAQVDTILAAADQFARRHVLLELS